jgi:hypothetical protein
MPARTARMGAPAAAIRADRAAALPAAELAAVQQALDGSRSVLVAIANHARQPLQLRLHTHIRGGFKPSTPPAVIEAGSTAAFGSQSLRGSVASGTEGHVVYAGPDFEVVLRWNNPYFGAATVAASLRGPRASGLQVRVRHQRGDPRVPVHLDLHEIDSGDFEVRGALLEAWAARGWGAGTLGLPTGPEVDSADRQGRWQPFANGRLVWRPDIGAHLIDGALLDGWLALGAERFGYPLGDPKPCADGIGRCQAFRRGPGRGPEDLSLWHHPDTGVVPVRGPIRSHWLGLGAERSRIGYPRAPQHALPGGRGAVQVFQRGLLLFEPGAGVRVVDRDKVAGPQPDRRWRPPASVHVGLSG